MMRFLSVKAAFALFLLMFAANFLQGQTFAKPNGVQMETMIAAEPSEIWAILLRFEDYPNWNPYITSIEGKAEKGKRLHIHIDGKEKDYDFKAKVLEMNPDSAFAWGGGALFFFKARHYFRLEQIAPGQTKFTQGESWRGLFGKSYGKKVYQEAAANFERMNLKLKELVE
jgi:hypothetical protein